MIARAAVSLMMVLLPVSQPVGAQSGYPNHPITMIVPFAAGGTSDVIARAVAEQMAVRRPWKAMP